MTLQKNYIPEGWDEIIGQAEIKASLSRYVTVADMPHLLFAGTSGVGKTACAYVLAKTLDVPIVELNASDERGIDTIRDKVKTLLFTAGERIILLDEGDNLTNDAQAALRRPMELAKERTDTRLIITVNRPWKIIDAISSRCTNFYFKPLTSEELKKIVIRVLKSENIKFSDTDETKKVVNALVTYSKGDARRLLSAIDTYSVSKESLLQYIMKKNSEVNIIHEIFQESISGHWKECLMKLEEWIICQPLIDNSEIVELFYKEIKELSIEPLYKFEIYKRLAEAERGMKISCSPLIQLSSFLISAMAITHNK